MLMPTLLLALGLACVFAPRLFATRSEAIRLRRLHEINEGGSEKYFEERRDLLAYKPSQRFFRVWGAAIAIGAASVLAVRSGITG